MKGARFVSSWMYPVWTAFLPGASFALWICAALGLKIPAWQCVLWPLFFSAACCAAEKVRKKGWLLAIFGIGAAGAALLFWLWEDARAAAKGLWDWWQGGFAADPPAGGVAVTALLLAFGLTAACYVVRRRYSGRLVLGLAMVAVLAVSAVRSAPAPVLAVALFAGYLAAVLAETAFRFRKEKDGRSGGLVAAYLLPLFVLVALGVGLLPAPDHPINWDFVADAARGVKQWVTKIGVELSSWGKGDGGAFSFTTGYSDSGGLGGDLSSSNRLAITVESYPALHSGLYLTGSVMDTYTGTAWLRQAQAPQYRDYELDLLEFAYALDRAGLWQNADRLVSARDITVRYEDLYTKSLFYPLKMTSIPLESSGPGYWDNEPTLSFRWTQGPGLSYRLSFLELNVESEEFARLVRSQEGYRYSGGVIDGLALSYPARQKLRSLPGPVPNDLPARLKERAEQIREDYLALPASLPDRVRQLSESLTKDCVTAYDRMKALEQYLQGFHYTLTPGNPPAGQDFTDYFLFDSKQGYCTYFATALAVMGRSVGIPTRYVQGFAGGEGDGKNQTFYSGNAHTWVEAYFEGVGWIPFEPTPSAAGSRYTEWIFPSDTPSGDSAGQPEQPGGEEQPLPPDEFEPEQLPPPPVPEPELPPPSKLPWLLLLLPAIVLMAAAVCALRVFGDRRRYRKADRYGRMLWDFARCLELLNRAGLTAGPGETLRVYAVRVTRHAGPERDSFQLAAARFEALRYGEVRMEEQDEALVRSVREWLEQAARVRLGWFRYGLLLVRLAGRAAKEPER